MKRNTQPQMPSFKDRPLRGRTRPYAVHRPNPDGLKYGIPKFMRRYAKRYGDGVDALASMHLKFPTEKLDHWADRKCAAAKLVAVPRLGEAA